MNVIKLFSLICLFICIGVILTECGPKPPLINFEPSLPNCIRIEPERCDWGNKPPVTWLVEGDNVTIHSVLYDRTRTDVPELPVYFYDRQMTQGEQDTTQMDARTVSLIGKQDLENSVPWRVPRHPGEEKSRIYARKQNYKHHILYGLIDPYNKLKEIDESNNVASAPVNILWEPKVDFTATPRMTVNLVEVETLKVERPIIPIIFFDPGSAEIRDKLNTGRMLQEISARLDRNHAATLVIKGYVDRDTDKGVKDLAQARAKAVRNAMIESAAESDVNVVLAPTGTYQDTMYFWRKSRRPAASSRREPFQEENRRVELEVEVSGASALDGKDVTKLTSEDVKQLVDLLTDNEDIVLILEKPYPSGPTSERLDWYLEKLYRERKLTDDMLGGGSIPQDPELMAMFDELEEQELTTLEEIEGHRESLLRKGGMSQFDQRVYLRTYQADPGPVRLKLSGDPIIYKPIKARIRFDDIRADQKKTDIDIVSSAGTKNMQIHVLNAKKKRLMTFGKIAHLLQYPDTAFTVSLDWQWDIGSQDSSRIVMSIDNTRNVIHRNFTWDWNKLDLESPDNSSLSLEVTFEDSACQFVTEILENLINIEYKRIVEVLHDVHIIVHCVFDQANPLSSYLELRTQDLARLLIQDLDEERERVGNVDASGHTCIVGTQQRNQRLSILRTVRTYRNFKNYLKIAKGFGSDEDLSRWLRCDITQSSWSYGWPYELRREGRDPADNSAVIGDLNETPEQRVANRRAEIEFVKRFQ